LCLNHPDFFTSAVFFALPKKLQEKTYALWRGIVGYVPDKNVTGSIQRQVRNLKWTGFELLQRTVGNSVHMNLAVSQAAADSLRGIGISQNKIRVIPEQVGGEYNSQIRQGPDYIERRNKLLRQDELGVLVVSRISYEKGLDWVLDLYEKLHDELKYDNGTNNQRPFNTVRLTIAGDATGTRNEYFEGLKKRKDAIDATHQGVNKVVLEFIGRQGREKLQELYNLYDVLFMPSPKEGFGRVTAEALMGGMPVIGRTVCDATREILDAAPETVGRLADSPTDAAESILGFMKDSSMLTEMQQNAVKWAGQYFSQQRAEQGFWEAIGK
jgi:glycosyltransferase involved in cell wall biosynthesis